MEQLWHVVEFADKSTAVVPTSWVQNRQCLWPPRDSINIHKAVKQQIKPGLDWTVHEQVRCLATCETYETAINCLKKSVEPGCATSDIESEAEMEERRKRKSKPNPKYIGTESECTRTIYISKPPPMLSPDLYRNYRSASEVLDGACPEDNFLGYHSHGDANVLQNLGSCDNYAEVQPQPRQMLRDIGLSKVVKMLAHIIEENKEMKEEIKKLSHDVKALRRDLVRQDTESALPAVISLPLRTMADLDQAEVIFRDPKERQKMTYGLCASFSLVLKVLSIMGGHSQELVVRRMLTHALSNGLASQLNWARLIHVIFSPPNDVLEEI